MKVAMLTSWISRRNAGVAEAARRLAQELVRGAGSHVEALALREKFSDEDAAHWAPVRPQLFASRGPSSYGYAPDLVAALAAMQPDICHVHGLWMYPTLAARRWSRKTARPYVVSPQGMLDSWALRHSRWKKKVAAALFENANLRRAACLHATSEAERAAIRAYGLRNPVAVIPNAVDLPPHDDSTAPPPWSIDGRKTLLYLGRIHPKKGLVPLLQAWSDAQPALHDWRLVLAGWDQGGHENELRVLAGKTRSVEFVGPQFGDAKAAAYANASAFVLPSFSEGLPIAVLEAWAHRLPVLITPACNLPESFAAGAALRAEPERGNLARGLRELAAMSATDRATMGARGRALVERDFTWPQVAGQFDHVYRWLVGGAAQPANVA